MCVYEDVQVDGGLNPPGSSGKRHSKMTRSCPNQKEEEGSAPMVVWTCRGE